MRAAEKVNGSQFFVVDRLAEGHAPVADRAVMDLLVDRLGVPRDASVVAVVRDNHVVVPRGDTVVQSGDEVLVLVTRESEEPMKRILISGD